MDEQSFLDRADAMLESLQQMLDRIDGLDVDSKPGGILEVVSEDGARIIINRHVAAREIWVAAPSGGWHFRFDTDRWVDTRNGEELIATLRRLLGAPLAQAEP
ncbi:MAG TPA: iron donor protein CyaY [Rhodocyclaceae bacterium]|nr:iron donor protein CyaY [Rhodocyclaceae bacterium]